MKSGVRAGLVLAPLLLSTAAFAQADQTAGDPAQLSQSSGGQSPAGTGRRAPSAQELPATPDALLGNWGGIRDKLHDAGITVTLGYKGEIAANVSGGERHDVTEVGQAALTAAFDMGKIAGIQGGTFQSSITFRHGHNLDQRAGLDVLQQVQEVYGRGQTWRLTELWYQQELAGGAVVLKVGRMPAAEFNFFDCDFQNLTFCGAPAGNITGVYWFNWPIAQWTGWAKFRRGDFYLKLGANEDNRNNLDNAFFISRGGARGVILHAEAGWTPGFGGDRPGRYQLGYWHTSGNDPDVLRDVNGGLIPISGLPGRTVGGQYGVYVQGQQQVTGKGKEDPVSGVITRSSGLNLFFNFTRNDPKTATTLDQETVGLYYNKPFAGRPNDNVGLAVGRTHYNGRAALALLLDDPAVQRRRNEYVSELYYAYHLYHGIVLRPNVQYIVNPGGRSDQTDAVVIGGRFDVNF